MKHQRKTLLTIVLLVASLLGGCGELPLKVNETPENGYDLVYYGTTDVGTEITYADKAGIGEKTVTEDGKFAIYIPRVSSEVEFEVIAKKDDAEVTKTLTVPKQKVLINYEQLKMNLDTFSIALPVSSEKDLEVTTGFKIACDGNDVMAFSLVYAPIAELKMGIYDYRNFHYSIEAIMYALESETGLSKVLDAFNTSHKKYSTTKVSVDDATYKFSTSNVGVTTLEIYPN